MISFESFQFDYKKDFEWNLGWKKKKFPAKSGKSGY